MFKTKSHFTIILLFAFLAVPLFAQNNQYYYKKKTDSYEDTKGISDFFQISVGAYLPSLDSVVRYDSKRYGVGTDVSFEDTLLMENSLVVLRMDGLVRLTRHIGLQFGYYNLSRSAENALVSEVIRFGDDVITGQAYVDSTFKTEVIKAALAISFINDGLVEFGISVGGNIVFLDASIDADILNTNDDVSESISETVPLPLAGAYGSVTISPGLLLKGSFQFMSLNIDEISGSSSDFRAVMEYYPLENFGLGAGINYNMIDVEVDTTEFSGKFDYSYSGFVAYITLTL
ncbi:MAG: hypothetical protein JW737_08405 [Acidobacteria bacterium]|nr:hypothetical protein [Acidobacteriota bacterium]